MVDVLVAVLVHGALIGALLVILTLALVLDDGRPGKVTFHTALGCLVFGLWPLLGARAYAVAAALYALVAWWRAHVVRR